MLGMSEEKKSFVFKLAILGDAGVGKTSLVNQYCENIFKEDYRATMGVHLIKKDIELENINSIVHLILWDIAGQDAYEKTRQKYYDGCTGALLVYDITRYNTFNSIEQKWIKDFSKHVKSNVPYVLIGNKTDLEQDRGVFSEDALKLASKINAADFIETSAKLGDNVEEAFLKLVQQILSNHGIKFE